MGMLRNPMLAVDEVFSPGPPPYFVILSEGAYRKVEERVRNTSDSACGLAQDDKLFSLERGGAK